MGDVPVPRSKIVFPIAFFVSVFFATFVVADKHVSDDLVGTFEAKAFIIEAAEKAYRNSRFESVEAKFSGSVLEVELRDEDACGDGATTRSINRVVDISVHAANIDAISPLEGNSDFRITMVFMSAGQWHKRRLEFSEKKAELLMQAQAEVGRGEQAALLASERFLQDHPLSALASYTLFGSCPSGQTISFDRDWISFQSPNPKKLLKSFSILGGG